MLELVRTTLVNHAKLVLVGVAAFALGGAGTVASVTLSSDSSPAPATSQSSDATETPDAPETPDATETPDAADTQDGTATGVRPSDTHGYCVSHAVAAAHTAGKTGKDVSAAAKSCPKPNKSTALHGKSAQPHGKSAQPHGKSSTHP